MKGITATVNFVPMLCLYDDSIPPQGMLSILWFPCQYSEVDQPSLQGVSSLIGMDRKQVNDLNLAAKLLERCRRRTGCCK